MGAVERPGPPQQGPVAAQGDQAVELRRAVERRGGRLGPERPDFLLGVQGDPEPGRDLREMREDVLEIAVAGVADDPDVHEDRKSTRLNSSHGYISYAVFCLKKKNT